MGIRDVLGAAKEGIKPAVIVQNTPFLSEPCARATLVEAIPIWKTLKATLKRTGGFGISANQIGIKKAVAFIDYKGKTYELLNPTIKYGADPLIVNDEGCLSFPKKFCNTVRYSNITIFDDNLGELTFSKETDELLPVIFQHEIDHLLGRTIFQNVRLPQRNNKENIGRNDLCPCHSGKKYKKCCLKELPKSPNDKKGTIINQ
jgi:peptide deformylase